MFRYHTSMWQTQRILKLPCDIQKTSMKMKNNHKYQGCLSLLEKYKCITNNVSYLPSFLPKTKQKNTNVVSCTFDSIIAWMTKFCPSLLVPASHLLANSCKVFPSAPSCRMLTLLWKAVSQPTYFYLPTQSSGKRVKCYRGSGQRLWEKRSVKLSWYECWHPDGTPVALCPSATSFYFIWLPKKTK